VTQKQRFLAALRLEQPDVVPVSPLIHWRYAHKVLGRSDWKAVYEVHRQLGSCHFRGPIGISYAYDMPAGFGVRSEEIAGPPPRRTIRETLHTPWGDLTSVTEYGMIPHDPLVHKRTEYFVKEPEQWKWVIAFWEGQLETARPTGSATVEEAVQLMGEDGVPSVELGSASTMVASQRGMQAFMTDLYDCPDLIRHALRVACDLYEVKIRSFLMTSAEVGFYDFCWMTGMNLGPQRFEDWVGEELARMCALVREVPGKFITFYTLGRMRQIMPTLMNARPHMIATFEPNQGDLTLAEAKRLYGDRVALMGNYDCVILARGTLEQAKEEARRCLREGMEGGGYILGTGDEVPADAIPENLQAMVDVCNEEGRY
jgi:uroporphyrinogen-III decarboxylase